MTGTSAGVGPAVEAVLTDLHAAVDGHVFEAADADSVDGVPARWVVSPGSTEETSAALRVAARHDLAVVPRGSGTKLRWGVGPERVDVVLDTTRMDALVEHASGDLIAVVGAGRRLDTLAADLAGAGQRLGVDPNRSGTLGGAVATGATGPLRLHHGAVRDLVIGVRIVRADGVVAHAGGKVVKNVAGYDLGKLLTGSYGTLGVITEVAVRLHPVPPARRWVVATSASDADLDARVRRLVHARSAPSAVELDRPDPAGGTLAVLLEGTGPGVDARVADTLALLGDGATGAEDPPSWWGSDPGAADSVLVKVTHELAGLGPLLAAVDTAAGRTGLRPGLRGSPAVGTAVVALAGDVDAPRLRSFVDEVRSRSGSFGGSVVVLEAPPGAREGVDVWGPVAAIDLMRSVKQQFDPGRRLAPGRFVGGI